MTALWTVIFTLFGVSIGSFLNVCIDRLPVGGSLLHPPSRCDSCGRRLTFYENVPVISYLALGGRCRTCGARIPRRVLLVEVLTGLLFLVAFLRFGLTPAFGVTAFWSCVFIVIIFIDKEHQLILNKVTYPAAVVAVLLLVADAVFPQAGLLANLRTFGHGTLFPVNAVVSGLLGGGIFFFFFVIVFLINPRGLGIGDLKLAALIGLVTGFPLVFVAMFVGIVLGGVVAVALVLISKKGRKDVMPYGVFLGVGPIIALLWGAAIMRWYLG
jgi:leader peptidase (prepilin peptidase)/N-methyltransferase